MTTAAEKAHTEIEPIESEQWPFRAGLSEQLSKQRVFYGLTEKAIELVPLMVAMGSWGLRHTRPATELALGAQVLEDGGPALWRDFMDELWHSTARRRSARHFGAMEEAYKRMITA